MTVKRKTRSADFVMMTREKLGLTQAELAAILEIERRTIMRYEGLTPLPTVVRMALLHLLASAKWWQ